MSSKSLQKKPSSVWWLFGVILLLIFMFVQLPVAWLVKRFAPQQNYLETVSGSLWKGQAQWQLPANMSKSATPVSGGVSWQWRPWEVLWLQGGADIHLTTGSSELTGRLGITGSTWQVQQLTGKLTADTLKQTLPLTWPNTDIKVQGVSLKGTHKGEKKDWKQAEGLLTWAGGEVGYMNMGKVQSANLPAMKAALSLEEKKLHISLTNSKDERMGDIYLDADSMVDVQLTQRLLLTVKGYKGNAAPDTAVVSVRQPLNTLGK